MSGVASINDVMRTYPIFQRMVVKNPALAKKWQEIHVQLKECRSRSEAMKSLAKIYTDLRENPSLVLQFNPPLQSILVVSATGILSHTPYRIEGPSSLMVELLYNKQKVCVVPDLSPLEESKRLKIVWVDVIESGAVHEIKRIQQEVDLEKGMGLFPEGLVSGAAMVLPIPLFISTLSTSSAFSRQGFPLTQGLVLEYKKSGNFRVRDVHEAVVFLKVFSLLVQNLSF